MPDWPRKYLGDVAWVAREIARDPAIAPRHQLAFANLYKLAKHSSRTTLELDAEGQPVRDVVERLCSACRDLAIHADCRPRLDWRQPCPLLSQRLLG